MNDLQILDHHDPEKGIWLIDNPNAPVIENPTPIEKINLNAWWEAVLSLGEKIVEEQRHIPGWLPVFKVIVI
jgi:hypothetical protein